MLLKIHFKYDKNFENNIKKLYEFSGESTDLSFNSGWIGFEQSMYDGSNVDSVLPIVTKTKALQDIKSFINPAYLKFFNTIKSGNLKELVLKELTMNQLQAIMLYTYEICIVNYRQTNLLPERFIVNVNRNKVWRNLKTGNFERAKREMLNHSSSSYNIQRLRQIVRIFDATNLSKNNKLKTAAKEGIKEVLGYG